MSLLKTAARLFRSWRGASPEKKNGRDSLHHGLQKVIGYQFNDLSLLNRALTHKSAIGSRDSTGLLSNERLEFLGDAVLNCLVTEFLFRRHLDYSEGQMSKMKSLIVSRKIIGEVGAQIHLGEYLTLGPSERLSGGHRRRSIISNAFEAVLGAMYLDGGLECVRRTLVPILFDRIDEFLDDERHMNYKSIILELSQRDGFGVPHYSVIATSGPEHAKKFEVGIKIAGVLLGKGKGSNKKIAQQNAAQNALAVYDKKSIESQIKEEVHNELLSDRRTADDSGDRTGDSAEENSPGS
jgi:ribonuclease-3